MGTPEGSFYRETDIKLKRLFHSHHDAVSLLKQARSGTKFTEINGVIEPVCDDCGPKVLGCLPYRYSGVYADDMTLIIEVAVASEQDIKQGENYGSDQYHSFLLPDFEIGLNLHRLDDKELIRACKVLPGYIEELINSGLLVTREYTEGTYLEHV